MTCLCKQFLVPHKNVLIPIRRNKYFAFRKRNSKVHLQLNTHHFKQFTFSWLIKILSIFQFKSSVCKTIRLHLHFYPFKNATHWFDSSATVFVNSVPSLGVYSKQDIYYANCKKASPELYNILSELFRKQNCRRLTISVMNCHQTVLQWAKAFAGWEKNRAFFESQHTGKCSEMGKNNKYHLLGKLNMPLDIRINIYVTVRFAVYVN